MNTLNKNQYALLSFLSTYKGGIEREMLFNWISRQNIGLDTLTEIAKMQPPLAETMVKIGEPGVSYWRITATGELALMEKRQRLYGIPEGEPEPKREFYYAREMRFSDSPPGHWVVREPDFVNEAGKLIRAVDRDINYFCRVHGLRFLNMIEQLPVERYKAPRYVGLFAGDEWEDIES